MRSWRAEAEDASGSARRQAGPPASGTWGRGAVLGRGTGARGACQTVSSSLMSQICVEKGRCSVSARQRERLRAVRPRLPVSTEAPPCPSLGRKPRLRARGSPAPGAPLGCGRALRCPSCRPSRGSPRRWPRSARPPQREPRRRRPRPAWGSRGLPHPAGVEGAGP